MAVDENPRAMDAPSLLRRAELSLRTTWIFMMMSVLLFLVFVLRRDIKPVSSPERSALLVQVLAGMALLLWTAGWLIRSHWALSSERLKAHLTKDLIDVSEDRTTAARTSSIRFLQNPCIVSWMLFEAIGVIGMVLFTLGITSNLVLGFIALGFGSILLSPPPFQRIYRQAEQEMM
jgi:hypothetical protein